MKLLRYDGVALLSCCVVYMWSGDVVTLLRCEVVELWNCDDV